MAGLSSPMVTSTDVAPDLNRTTVPITGSVCAVGAGADLAAGGATGPGAAGCGDEP